MATNLSMAGALRERGEVLIGLGELGRRHRRSSLQRLKEIIGFAWIEVLSCGKDMPESLA